MSPDDRVHAPRTVLVANPSADLYGSDRMLLEAVRGLVGMGWRAVVTCSVDGPLVAEMRDAGAEVRVMPAPVVRKNMLSPRGFFALVRDVVSQLPHMRRLVKEVQPDVVLANTVTIPFWSIAARTCGRPVVVYVHEAEAALPRPARALLTAPLRLATGVVFNSQTSRQVSGSRWLENHGRVRVVANGVQGPADITPARESIDGPFRIVYVGRLSPRKGVDLVVSAAARLRDEGIEPQVDLVGAVFPGYEWYESELKEQVERLGLTSHVRFAGFEDVVWEHFAHADVAVVPSRLDESFGNVLIEALLSERPVVAADHSGLREAARGFDAAVLVTADDADALAGGLRGVHDLWAHYRQSSGSDRARAQRRYGTATFHTRLSAALEERARPRRGSKTTDRRAIPAEI